MLKQRLVLWVRLSKEHSRANHRALRMQPRDVRVTHWGEAPPLNLFSKMEAQEKPGSVTAPAQGCTKTCPLLGEPFVTAFPQVLQRAAQVWDEGQAQGCPPPHHAASVEAGAVLELPVPTPAHSWCPPCSMCGRPQQFSKLN